MTHIPPLIGPIETGASFMIASLQNERPYILNTAPFAGDIIYYWEDDLRKIVNDSSMGVFTSQGTVDSLTISDSLNGGGLGFRSGGVVVGHAGVPSRLKMEQPSYATWWPPDIFLSAVVYTMYDASTGLEAEIFTARSGTGSTGPNIPTILTIPANNIIIVPVLWYSNCASSGTYDLINQPLSSVVNWFCVANSSGMGCSDIPILKSGWTNLPDCVTGNFYSYCPVNDLCGNNACNGPCSVIYNDCTFSSSSNNFSCVFNPERFINDTKWWQSPYFIGAVIGIVAIILIIIVIFVVIYRRNSQPVNSY